MNSTNGLSEGALRLAVEVGVDGELAPHLKEHPELLESVDEYMKWRDASHISICHQEEAPGMAHSLKTTLRKITK